MIEIELNESLRRRRDELRGKIETLSAAEAGDASAADELENRTRELKALSNDTCHGYMICDAVCWECWD
ncbi:hypothetical protein PHLCEN_2v314 [Hermanssonia centrifuga]|uniref:Uncharacterized protein n=1 Tax=Hermanssonia centrifuga TaxID=98765 RepID=A0A2R6S6F7_9APHY|nr:hypothetical protein PHLCEN_2v314 [Hermanssonia centrifuga]